MTQEDKKLLLKDLCARLPFNVKIHNPHPRFPNPDEYIQTLTDIHGTMQSAWITFGTDNEEINVNWNIGNKEEDVPKPYLRPLSSMSEDEIYSVAGIVIPGLPHNIDETKGTCSVCCHSYTDEIEQDFSVRDLANGIYGIEGLDWLTLHHFDYRGLITKGLALVAPEGMYNTNTE